MSRIRGTAPLWVRRGIRVLVAFLVRVFYRVELERGLLPERGPALVVANHTAYVDPFVLVACTRYPLRFVYWHGLDQLPFIGAFCRFSGGIPIAGALERPELYASAMREIHAALEDGEVVAVFPEGALTRDGALARFKRGVEEIVRSRPVPVTPVAIDGLWGSMFSRAPQRRPRRFRPEVRVLADPAVVPESVTAETMHAAVSRLLPASSVALPVRESADRANTQQIAFEPRRIARATIAHHNL